MSDWTEGRLQAAERGNQRNPVVAQLTTEIRRLQAEVRSQRVAVENAEVSAKYMARLQEEVRFLKASIEEAVKDLGARMPEEHSDE